MDGSGLPVAMQTHCTPSRTMVHLESSRKMGATVGTKTRDENVRSFFHKFLVKSEIVNIFNTKICSNMFLNCL